ncbi:MAG: CocE/NonD family hydrolase [Flavobacteriales bacterium]|nr:CocE/NonD family hydrolase [Flavobacteriales bacterium]
MRVFNSLLIFVLFISLFIPGICNAQVLTPQVDSIPMRDGKKLAADIYIPQGGGTFPVILIQTPYNRLYYRLGLPLGFQKNLDSSPYIFVIVDWRCFYGSQGACIAQPNRGQDGKDVVDWIAAQSWSNGKVGTWGPSALGKIQFQTAREQPAALVCSVPLVAGSQFNYEEYFPGGCYRKEYADQLDALGYGLSPFLLANPVHNLTWQIAEGANLYPDQIKVPMLMIGGWYDHNVDVMTSLFNLLKSSGDPAVKDQHRLVMGPWAHGGFGQAQVGSGQQGELFYPEASGWSDSLALAFLDYHLRGIANNWPSNANVTGFQMGDNVWETFSSWPPVTQDLTLYLHEDDTLRESSPAVSSSSTSLQYDPRDPSPTIGGPTLHQDLDQGPYDQAPIVESRNDILTFTTPPLQQDVKVQGEVRVHLYMSSDRKDTDICLRLTDVYPDNRSMLVSDQVLRMRFRDGYTASDTAVMVPGQVYEVELTFDHTAITFPAGHRIRLDITSSNYPRFDANLNNGGAMYVAGDTLIATNTFYHETNRPARVILPVSDATIGMNDISEPSVLPELFPNPAHHHTTVRWPYTIPLGEVVKITCYDLIGNMVVTTSVDQQHLKFSTEEFTPGIYLIRMEGSGKSYTRKLVVR